MANHKNKKGRERGGKERIGAWIVGVYYSHYYYYTMAKRERRKNGKKGRRRRSSICLSSSPERVPKFVGKIAEISPFHSEKKEEEEGEMVSGGLKASEQSSRREIKSRWPGRPAGR